MPEFLKFCIMKKKHLIPVAAAAMLLSSCAPKFGWTSSYLDYSQYSAQGFFITESGSTPFEYTPIGSMAVTENNGLTDKIQAPDPVKDKDIDGIYTSNTSSNKWRYATSSSALNALVEKAKETGANGIINLKIYPVYEKSTIVGYTVSGMLIKR